MISALTGSHHGGIVGMGPEFAGAWGVDVVVEVEAFGFDLSCPACGLDEAYQRVVRQAKPRGNSGCLVG
jgi:hypothetical protein